jgi:hypothetical protein
MPYELLVLAHILVIGYWLGTDLAVYYISSAIVDPDRPVPVRIFAAKVMLLLDMVPRTALILTLLIGLSLAGARWLPPSLMAAWWLWPLLLAWLALTWAVFRLEHAALGHTLARVDFAFRILVMLACFGLAIALFAGAGPFTVLPWLAGKLAIMGLIIALGLIIRIQLKPFGPLFGLVAQGQADAATEARLQRLIARVKIPVWVIWISLVVAAVLGSLKPMVWL